MVYFLTILTHTNLCTLSSALPDGQYETARFVDLPVEVIENIVFWLPKASLLHLCAASRALYLQAAQFLFHNVKLHDSQNQQILLWCQLISENNHLAQSVKSLSLPLVLGGEDLRHRHRVEELHGALFRALRCLDNLESLEILESNRNRPTILLTTILSHIDVNLFLGCNFRLKSFGYGGFLSRRAVLADEPWTSADLTTFLREQNQIKDWRTALELNDLGGNESLLPALSTFRTTYHIRSSKHYQSNSVRLFELLGSRKISHLWLNIATRHWWLDEGFYEAVSTAFAMFATCETHLSHLYFNIAIPKPRADSDVSLLSIRVFILCTIAETFPGIKSLDYSKDVSSVVCGAAMSSI